MNNQTLSLHRLGLVMRHDLRNNLKTYILQTSFLWATMFIVIFFVLPHYGTQYVEYESTNPDTQTLRNWFFIFLFGSGCLFASMMGDDITSKNRRIATLMLPASMLEKYAAQWLKYVIICPVVFYIGWILMDLLATGVITMIWHNPEVPILTFTEIASANIELPELILLYLCTQSVFILGAAFWPRFSCIKTMIAMWVIGMVEAGILWLVVFRPLFYSGQYKYYMQDEVPINDTFVTVIVIAVTLFNWILPYFRFKETDVVTRV